MNAHSTRSARHTNERTPNPLLGAIVCLAILTGGAFAGTSWTQAQCDDGVDLGVVCQATA